MKLAVLKHAHNDGTATVCSSMLSEVVTSTELLSTFVAFERFILSVQGSIVTLEVFLSAEPTRAKVAYERLAWILCQGLLAASSVGRTT